MISWIYSIFKRYFSNNNNNIENNNKYNIPKHVAIIADGNRRWETKNNLTINIGHLHRLLILNMTKLMRDAKNIGIKYFTIYGLSTENMSRDANEVEYMLNLLENNLNILCDISHGERIRLNIIGNYHNFPSNIVSLINLCNANTRHYDECIFTLCLSYSGQMDIVECVKNICREHIDVNTINYDTIKNNMQTRELPPVDLMIRTGGDVRISNFLLWDLAYSELIFDNTLFPDFTINNLLDAIRIFNSRQRRYGK